MQAIGLGDAQFYDEFSAQFNWKLPKGGHTFRVKSKCGENQVKSRSGRGLQSHAFFAA